METAALQLSPGNETHISPFGVDLIGPGGDSRLYLHSSPEFDCKKLLAAGEERIFASPMSSATASAPRCTIPNSPCSNGIAPTSPLAR